MLKPSQDLAPVSAEWLDNKIASGEAGPTTPLLRAVRFAGIGLVTALPGEVFAPLIETVRGRPWVAIIGDDEGAGRGPGAFHRQSLLAVCRAATRTVVCPFAPSEGLCGVYAMAAAKGERVLLIATDPAQKAAWCAFVRKHPPQAACLEASAVAGTA